jgi:hypothetical protein
MSFYILFFCQYWANVNRREVHSLCNTSWDPIVFTYNHNNHQTFPFRNASLIFTRFSTKFPYASLFSLCVPHVLPISFSLIVSPEKYLLIATNREVPHHAIFSSFRYYFSSDPSSFRTHNLGSVLNVTDQVSHP